MYRLRDIQFALRNLVGWHNSYNPSNYIDEDCEKSTSGLYFQDAHPMLTIENMKSIMPDEYGLKYSQWNMLQEYRKGMKVSHNGLIWIAKIDNVNQEPTASDFNDDYSKEDFGNPYWRPYNALSDYLREMTDRGIAATIQTFAQIKKLDKMNKSILERKSLFDGAGRLTATIQNTHKIVGFEIVPLRSMGVTAKIEKLGLQFLGGTGDIKIYLFHSSKSEPVKTFNLSYTAKNGGFQWFDIEDCYLPYINDETDAGGAWYLCYNQDELPFGMEAICVSKDWSREPCGTCNIGSLDTWRKLMQYANISPFMADIPEGFEDEPMMWDVATNIYTNTQNYGMNCNVSILCDLTDFIISQQDIFATALQRQVAYTAIRTLAMNPDVRVNRNQSNATRMDLLYELDGNTDSARERGLGYDLRKAYEALNLDTTGLDRACLSCNNHGIRFGSI